MNAKHRSLLEMVLHRVGILVLALAAAVLVRKVFLGARFVSNDSQTPVPTGETADLDREALAALPSSLRAELADALLSLDAERIAGSIRPVAELSPVLGSVLAHHAAKFRYSGILRALQSCQAVVPTIEATS